MLFPVRSRIRETSSSLAAVLSTPQARAVAISSALARVPKGMIPLATVLVLRQSRASFAVAGLTAALIALGDAASTPAQGRLVDRFGMRRVLLPLALVHVGAVAVLLSSVGHAPEAVIVACGVTAGVGVPPVSGSVKAVWPRVVAPEVLPTAYTVESLLQQLVFLSGPLLVAVVSASVSPAAALATAAVAVLAGTSWFVVVAPDRQHESGRRARADSVVRQRVVAVLMGSALLQGVAFGGVPVGLVAVAAAAHRAGVAGVIQAMLTIGGVLGTALPTGASDRRALVRLTALFAVGLGPVALLALRPGLTAVVLTGVTLLCAGLLLTPVAATSYVILQRRVGSDRRTESFAWLSTGQASGNALGAAAVGVLLDRFGVPVALAVLPVAVGAAALLTLFLPEETDG